MALLLKLFNQVNCEAPSSSYRRPNQPSNQQPFMPTYPPDNYGPPPPIPSTSYGMPEEPLYGAPTPGAFYGQPSETPSPIIHKHVYVHVPPPEPEYTTPRRPPDPQPVHKHYRIIFIKTPTQPVPTLPTMPELPLSEEKTIVYVLVRKPDNLPEIVMPTPASTSPSKPEVYFIRYKTEQSTSSPGSVDSGGYYRK